MIREAINERNKAFDCLSEMRGDPIPKYLNLIERAVVHAGIELQGIPLPPNYARGIPKMCFQNARRLAGKRRALCYHEGFVIRRDIGFPIHHGWCVNRAGQVIDVTLERPEEGEYLGVPFSFEEIKRWRSPHSTSLFDTGRGINVALCEYWLNQPKQGTEQ